MSWKDLDEDEVASRLLHQPIRKRFPGEFQAGLFNGTIVSWDASSRRLMTLYEDGNSDGLYTIPASCSVLLQVLNLFKRMPVLC